mmetsp:Transcript_22673/g.66012  ORF Transcript_22673/g.66012 Transcript_22673/m.66012 type:complete len:231 (+) Transcript_22673:453-1145(+)
MPADFSSGARMRTPGARVGRMRGSALRIRDTCTSIAGALAARAISPTQPQSGRASHGLSSVQRTVHSDPSRTSQASPKRPRCSWCLRADNSSGPGFGSVSNARSCSTQAQSSSGPSHSSHWFSPLPLSSLRRSAPRSSNRQPLDLRSPRCPSWIRTRESLTPSSAHRAQFSCRAQTPCCVRSTKGWLSSPAFPDSIKNTFRSFGTKTPSTTAHTTTTGMQTSTRQTTCSA